MNQSLTLNISEDVYKYLLKAAEQTGQVPEMLAAQWLTLFTRNLHQDDPLEPFIRVGLLQKCSYPDWTYKHDEHLGQAQNTDEKILKFCLDRQRIDKIPKESMTAEIKRVAEVFEFRRFSGKEFDKVSTLCKRSAITKKEFGSWDNALASTGLELKPHKNKRSDAIPEVELFNELERVWRSLEHRPSRTEWEVVETKYSYTTYKSRFHGWVNACAAFIEFRSDANAAALDQKKTPEDDAKVKSRANIRAEEKRTIPLGLRLQVLKRDQFRCIYCGNSPAIDAGVVLHIDHVKPFSKGGKTILDNLQTLCEACNFGKGSEEF